MNPGLRTCCDRSRLELSGSFQQPTASRSVRHACAIRELDSDATQRRKEARGTVWTLSKLTTHAVGTPSSPGVSSSSDTRPRCVRVRAATTTAPMRSATGSRVSTSTGRSPPGVAANQISPRCMAPISPILGRPPVRDPLKRALRISERHPLPSLNIVLAAQAHQVPMKSVAENLRALHPERFRPALNRSSLGIGNTKTKHRHTGQSIMYDTHSRDRVRSIPTSPTSPRRYPGFGSIQPKPGSQWRRWESNPRPQSRVNGFYERSRRSDLILESPRRRGSRGPAS